MLLSNDGNHHTIKPVKRKEGKPIAQPVFQKTKGYRTEKTPPLP
jgi:hypothetical protein